MRTLLVSVLLIGVIAAAVVGIVMQSPTPEKKYETFAELKGDYMQARQKIDEMPPIKQAREEVEAAQKAMSAAKTSDEMKAARTRGMKAEVAENTLVAQAVKPINKEYSLKFLQFAQDHKKDPKALESLANSLHATGGPFEAGNAWNATMKEIEENQLTNADIRKIFQTLNEYDNDAAQSVMRAVIAKHPDRKVQGRAARALANAYSQFATLGQQLKANPEGAEQFAKETSKEYVARVVSRIDTNNKELEALRKTMREKYSDVIPDLSIGKPAPEVISQGLDGKPVKLSDLKGKVVVLDFWATWCGPCRGMIPHEREMVERLKDKPFALVSISADEPKKELEDFLEKENMPWTHWWSGEAGVVEDWDIDHFPTIFVLDSKGVIRYTEIRGKELEEAVMKLLDEMKPSGGQ